MSTRQFLGNHKNDGKWYAHYQDGYGDEYREWWEQLNAQDQALLNFLEKELEKEHAQTQGK